MSKKFNPKIKTLFKKEELIKNEVSKDGEFLT